MKRQSISFILLLLLTLTILCGCSSSETEKEAADAAIPLETVLEETAAEITEETAVVEAAKETAVAEMTVTSDTDSLELIIGDTSFEDVTGIFEGLEDNHTALFSFDGVEVVFFFEDSEVQSILSEAVVGSSYHISYTYDSARGLNVLYEISE